MSGDTTITVIGNLTDSPELRFTPAGAAVANFTVASTPRTFDRNKNEWVDGDALFMRCNIWREAAENVAESLTRGSRVIVSGRLKQRSYETREGEKRTVVELEVDEIGPSLKYATAKVNKADRKSGGARTTTASTTQDDPGQPTRQRFGGTILTDHWFIPKQEQVELVDALTDVSDILDDLREAQKPRIATANWNPKVSTGDRPQPLPFNVAAVDAADRLLICLETWAWFLADARGITAVHATCSGYADWLTRNILLLAATPGSESAHHDITTEIRHARNASGRSHLQPIPKPNPQRLAQAHAEQLNARGIAILAKHIGAQGLTIRRIKHLRETGKIVPARYADKRTPIYQLGDVLNAHYATPERNRIAV